MTHSLSARAVLSDRVQVLSALGRRASESEASAGSAAGGGAGGGSGEAGGGGAGGSGGGGGGGGLSRKALSESAARLQEDIDVPRRLHCYAPYAHALVVELEQTLASLEAEKARRAADAAVAAAYAPSPAANAAADGAEAAPAETAPAAPIELPSLRWDTSVLDMEEDRVIWVRESDLGKVAHGLVEP